VHIPRSSAESIDQFVTGLATKSIQSVRPVDRDGRHAVALVIKQIIVNACHFYLFYFPIARRTAYR
jgi:hypothetical protein